jgi:hypothetical protein
MDEKNANLYHARLTIHLQERLVHLSSLSYNELASAAIDQGRMMNAITEADENWGNRPQFQPQQFQQQQSQQQQQQ